MRIERIGGICICIALASAAATGQQTVRSPGTVESAIEHRYLTGAISSWRQVQTRTEIDGREVVVETEEMGGADGKTQPIQEIVTETVRTGSGALRTRRDVFTFDPDRHRRLVATSESEQQSLAAAGSATVQNGWVPDINGRFHLASRRIERTQFVTPGVHQTDTALFQPNLDDVLQENERVEHTERQINSTDLRHDSTHLVRDLNGRWQATETWTIELREAGPSEHLEEDTVRRPDLNGTWAVTERSVVRSSATNGGEQTVIETYTRDREGYFSSDSPLGLSQRTRVSTTTKPDGDRYTVEEVERRSPVAPSGPMRIVRRTLATTRSLGVGHLVTERQIFELDINGRLAAVATVREESTVK
jgi:hypothetical protein